MKYLGVSWSDSSRVAGSNPVVPVEVKYRARSSVGRALGS